jgi:hypothetical protein
MGMLRIDMGYLILLLTLSGWVLSSWVTHLIVCFNEGSWGFLIAGAIFFPIAVIHGTWSWF